MIQLTKVPKFLTLQECFIISTPATEIDKLEEYESGIIHKRPFYCIHRENATDNTRKLGMVKFHETDIQSLIEATIKIDYCENLVIVGHFMNYALPLKLNDEYGYKTCWCPVYYD